jgi:hypothetical protein
VIDHCAASFEQEERRAAQALTLPFEQAPITLDPCSHGEAEPAPRGFER